MKVIVLGAGVVGTGVRPVTPSGTPILGRSPIVNLYIAAGHGHLGWTMGAVRARLRL